MRKSPGVLLALACACAVSFAQKPTGSVTGHVTCADTNTPARLAGVVLRPVVSKISASGPDHAVEARLVHSLLDGSFAVTGVGPGAYYVLASMPGYISPLTALGVSNDELLEPTDELLKRVAERVPIVTVEANASASINISLERGASVSGTILFDDGSPAPGIRIHLVERKNGKWGAVQTTAGDNMTTSSAVSDDRGNYRMSGLPPVKEALVQADLNVSSGILQFRKDGFGTGSWPTFTLSFFSGAVLRTKDAKPFSLTTGEERPGEDIVLPLAKLHKVQGALVAHRDGHELNEGSVTLLFADDKTSVGVTNVSGDDSTFSFAFVPEGDYILKVNSAADARFDEIPNTPGIIPPTRTEKHILREYGTAELPIHIEGDRSDITIDVPDKAPPAKNVAQQ
jgi:hypothetical protein